MMPNDSQNTTHKIPWLVSALVLLCLGVLSVWSWQKWDTVWVERSEGFFPPEWQNQDIEALAWNYPIYRSNDTYQWVYMADSLAKGNPDTLLQHPKEGPPGGRPNAWNSGLAHLLHQIGNTYASFKSWPTERGIHASAHWLGAVILLCTIGIGILTISRVAGVGAAVLFAGLYYFNAAINWDFAFSRLDHESLFQLFFLLQLLGLIGLIKYSQHSTTRWALIAGIGTAACWWISATVQLAISVFCMLALLWTCHQKELSESHQLPKSLILWGAISAIGILLACVVEHRSPLKPTLSALHPIFAITQLGACLVCAAALLQKRKSKLILLGIGLVAGLTPLIWIGIYQEAAHIWFNPVIRRVHDYIVEFQSPFHNGVWSQASFAQAAVVLLGLLCCRPWRTSTGRFILVVSLGLFTLALMQTRWLGLFAAAATIGLCLSLAYNRYSKYISISALAIFAVFWIWQWNRIEEKPGRVFVADMFLQVGARDINLNLERLANSTRAHVAIPYAFAATSALFENIHPLGTLYWENHDGIADSAALFATSDDTEALRIVSYHNIRYLAVQTKELGGPFAEMATWTALDSKDPHNQKTSLAWRLSNGVNVPTWCEPIPFLGTFDPARFSMMIYKVR